MLKYLSYMKKDLIGNISKRRFFLIPGFCTLVLFVIAIFFMNQTTKKMLSAHEKENNEYLFEINKQIATTIDEKIFTNQVFINSISTMINSQQDFEKKETVETLKTERIQHNFLRIKIINLDGLYHIEENNIIDISDRDYFKEALKGNSYVSDILNSKFNEEKIIVYSSPIKNNQKIIGVLIGIQSVDSLLQDFNIKTFNEDAILRIVDKNSNYILSSKDKNFATKNVYDEVGTIWQDYDSGLARINEIITNQETGVFKYTENDETEFTLIYTPISYNNWYLFTKVPSNVLPDKTIGHTQLLYNLCISLGILLLVFIVGISLFQIKSQKVLQNIAFLDSLTGEGNQTWFTQKADELIKANPDTKYAVVAVDLYQFKLINDKFGRTNGDKTLKYVFSTIKSLLKENEIIVRSSSDNFKVLIKYETDQLCIERLKEWSTQINNFNTRVKDDDKFFIYLVCGICPVEHSVDKTTQQTEKFDLLACYDRCAIALSTSKPIKDSYLRCGFFDEWDLTVMIQHKIIENRMKSALKNEEFQIYLQPKYDIVQNKIAGAEALVRWADPTRGMIPPNDFIPLFESNGFILDLDLYVFDRTCHLLRQWIDKGVEPVVISVNLSRAYLHDFTFLGKFEEIRRKYEVPTHFIELELTETVVFENMNILADIINAIHDLGYSCSIDDFGSGYSSLNILKNIPVDTIKIDRGFFVGENSDTVKSDTIIRSVIDLARKLKMKTVSEGIEYKDQVEFLRDAKCDMIQGYYFSKPIPITEFEKLAFGLVISGKRTLPSESQNDGILQPEEYLESLQDFTESNFPASVILRKKSSDE